VTVGDCVGGILIVGRGVAVDATVGGLLTEGRGVIVGSTVDGWNVLAVIFTCYYL